MLRRLLLVGMLVAAGIMTAMAYEQAGVENPAGAAVVRTDSALLALQCGEYDEYTQGQPICLLEGGSLSLDFGHHSYDITNEEYTIDDVEDYGADHMGTHWELFIIVGGMRHSHPLSSNEHSPSPAHAVNVENVVKDPNSPNCFLVPWQQDRPGNNPPKGTAEICITGNGGGGTGYGFQANSSYTFEDLFVVKNNSNDTVRVGIQLSSEFYSQGLSTTLTTGPGDVELFPEDNQVTLGPGEFASITFHFQTGQFETVPDEPLNGFITVTAESFGDGD